MHATDVPIAVPVSCRKCRLPNSNMLFFITKLIAFLTALVGNFSASCAPRLSSQSLITLMAWSVPMVVYIDTASAVTSLAFGGSVPRSERLSSSWELFLM